MVVGIYTFVSKEEFEKIIEELLILNDMYSCNLELEISEKIENPGLQFSEVYVEIEFNGEEIEETKVKIYKKPGEIHHIATYKLMELRTR